MNVRESIRERDRARKWFADLRRDEKEELGDQFVLGTFDWRDWGFSARPTGVFLREVERERTFWESEDWA